MRPYVVVLISFLTLPARLGSALPFTAVRADEVVAVEGRMLPLFDGQALGSLVAMACESGRCVAIPMQVDERGADGRWILDHGPDAGAGPPRESFDGNDVVLVMAADAGERVLPRQLPAFEAAAEIAIYDPRDSRLGWVYILAAKLPIAPAERSYVHYDPVADRIRGTDVSMGFAGGVPGYLAIDDGPNLLDRLKVRASARLLFGLFRFARSEEDLSTEFAGWHEGPIRIIRCQRQRIRLGWGIRSPTFGSYTYFYRAAADLPVALYLNHAATYFVSDVEIRAILDFRNLNGWQVIVPQQQPLAVGGGMDARKQAVNRLEATWFALRGPRLTLIQSMEVSESLSSTRRRLIYREGESSVEPPETFAGEEPGVGYRLDRWDDVGAGQHGFAALSYAVANDVNVEEFIESRRQPLAVYTSEIPCVIVRERGLSDR